MKKTALIISILLILISASVFASEADIEISAPKLYCYQSSANGHSAVGAIVINDEVISDIANMDEDTLYDMYKVNDASNIQIQFDYSVGDDKNWHHLDSWEPDKYGFFKSPLVLRSNASKDTFEGQIMNLEFDEYLDLVYDYTYTGNNDGWTNVNIYDFDTYPLYIRARFVYTLENPSENLYIPLVSDWSEAVKVNERVIIDKELLSAPTIIIESELKKDSISVSMHFDEQTKELIGNLGHYEEDLKVEFLYAFDDEEFKKAEAETIAEIGKEYLLKFPSVSEDPMTLKIKARAYFDGNDRYDIAKMDSGYSQEATLLLKEVSQSGSEDPDNTKNPDNNGDADNNPLENQKLLIIAACAVAGFIIGIIFGRIRKKKNK
ncbi:MAG: hypothetical protein E7218_08435 [Anaerofustis stercorihominis]|nr:hypothetical protein [Anaerofustis stercorihominis]